MHSRSFLWNHDCISGLQADEFRYEQETVVPWILMQKERSNVAIHLQLMQFRCQRYTPLKSAATGYEVIPTARNFTHPSKRQRYIVVLQPLTISGRIHQVSIFVMTVQHNLHSRENR